LPLKTITRRAQSPRSPAASSSRTQADPQVQDLASAERTGNESIARKVFSMAERPQLDPNRGAFLWAYRRTRYDHLRGVLAGFVVFPLAAAVVNAVVTPKAGSPIHKRIEDGVLAGLVTLVAVALLFGLTALIVASKEQRDVLRLQLSNRNASDTSADDDTKYALGLVHAKAGHSPSAAVKGNRNYRIFAVMENTAAFPIRIELVKASMTVNGHGPDPATTWTVTSHILQGGKSVEVPLPDVPDLTWKDVQAGAMCTGLFRFQRPENGKYFRCELDFTATPNGYDTNGWPIDWDTALNREIEYGDWV